MSEAEEEVEVNIQDLVQGVMRKGVPLNAKYPLVLPQALVTEFLPEGSCRAPGKGVDVLIRAMRELEQYGRQVLQPEAPTSSGRRSLKLSETMFSRNPVLLKNAVRILKLMSFQTLANDDSKLMYPWTVDVDDEVVTDIVAQLLVFGTELKLIKAGEHPNVEEFGKPPPRYNDPGNTQDPREALHAEKSSPQRPIAGACEATVVPPPIPLDTGTHSFEESTTSISVSSGIVKDSVLVAELGSKTSVRSPKRDVSTTASGSITSNKNYDNLMEVARSQAGHVQPTRDTVAETTLLGSPVQQPQGTVGHTAIEAQIKHVAMKDGNTRIEPRKSSHPSQWSLDHKAQREPEVSKKTGQAETSKPPGSPTGNKPQHPKPDSNKTKQLRGETKQPQHVDPPWRESGEADGIQVFTEFPNTDTPWVAGDTKPWGLDVPREGSTTSSSQSPEQWGTPSVARQSSQEVLAETYASLTDLWGGRAAREAPQARPTEREDSQRTRARHQVAPAARPVVLIVPAVYVAHGHARHEHHYRHGRMYGPGHVRGHSQRHGPSQEHMQQHGPSQGRAQHRGPEQGYVHRHGPGDALRIWFHFCERRS